MTQIIDRYQGNDNYGRPKQDYLNKIKKLTDKELLKETEEYIWLSAYANNNPRSDFHWMVTACYDEWSKREKVDQYEIAYNNVRKSCGFN